MVWTARGAGTSSTPPTASEATTRRTAVRVPTSATAIAATGTGAARRRTVPTAEAEIPPAAEATAPAERTLPRGGAAGTCTGFVNGEFMANERTLLRGAGGGLLSCGAARTISKGTLTYTRNTATTADDVEVDYIAESQGTFGQIVSRVRGRVSGESVGTVNFRGDESSLRECEAGTSRGGIYDTVGQSITPLVG